MLVGNKEKSFKVLKFFFFQLIKVLHNSKRGICHPVIHTSLPEEFKNACDAKKWKGLTYSKYCQDALVQICTDVKAIQKVSTFKTKLNM